MNRQISSAIYALEMPKEFLLRSQQVALNPFWLMEISPCVIDSEP